MPPSETTRLLPAGTDAPPAEIIPLSRQSFLSPLRRLLLTVLLLSISFVYTATPLVFAFRTMMCDILYEEGKLSPYKGAGDRCARREVESETSKAIAVMVTLTTISGVLNLLTTGYIIRRWGVKLAMCMQTFWPVIRNICQTIAIYSGGRFGIRLIQWTQLLTILGGGAGYYLCANTYVNSMVLPEERTATFGILQGTAMFGSALAYALGGLTGDWFGPPAPFEVTLCLLILSTLLSTFFLPYVAPPAKPLEGAKDQSLVSSGVLSFLAPLRVFIPSIANERPTRRYWGVTLLGVGVFTGVLAVSFVPFLLQLTATNAFGFHPTENGVLMSTNALSRAAFLTLAFPKIIARGRKLYTTSSSPPSSPAAPGSPQLSPAQPDISAFDSRAIETGGEVPEEAAAIAPLTDVPHGSQFDLVFVRSSMIVDGILTASTMLAGKGWHLYLAAAILPLASGTAPASKGVMMEIVPIDQQSDALAAIALVETLSTVLTVSGFGILFAKLSEMGLARYTFAVNAGLAWVSAFVYFLVRFPNRKASATLA